MHLNIYYIIYNKFITLLKLYEYNKLCVFAPAALCWIVSQINPLLANLEWANTLDTSELTRLSNTPYRGRGFSLRARCARPRGRGAARPLCHSKPLSPWLGMRLLSTHAPPAICTRPRFCRAQAPPQKGVKWPSRAAFVRFRTVAIETVGEFGPSAREHQRHREEN